MIICILGRQPELGLAELEALYGVEHVTTAGTSCAVVNTPTISFPRLGSVVKTAELLATIQTTHMHTVYKRIMQLIPSLLEQMPHDGKIKLGLSTYGFDVSPYQLNGDALRLKRLIHSAGYSVRVVPVETAALSSAQTYHNKLTSELGIEFAIVRDNNTMLIGRVNAVQDIDSYRHRDRERPKRDPFVGMLPPKLAQTIINLATGSHTPHDGLHILDPFCGTGVIVQEALLMGYGAYGTDISPKMIEYTRANLRWLTTQYATPTTATITQADATTATWHMPPSVAIASETYLGQPLGGQNPTTEKITEIIHDTNTLIRQFLQNIAPQLSSGTRLCLAIPAWYLHNEVMRLPLTADITQLGFNTVSFSLAPTPLIYHRENQITGRELLVLTRQ